MNSLPNSSSQSKCGHVALIGAPNAGKSTLLNQMIGAKVSIVSPKIQTTRAMVTGIYSEENTQLIFIDTPGIFKPDRKRRLERSIVKTAMAGLERAEIIALLVDSRKGICPNTEMILEFLEKTDQPVVVILNKIDVADKNNLLELATLLQKRVDPVHIFMISALKNDGVADIIQFLMDRCQEGEWIYDEDQISTAPIRLLATEITREKIFLNLDQELPYSITVEAESWQEEEDSVTIHQVVYVLKETQKGIVLGKKGAMIKQIGQQARREIAAILEKKVHLYLHVKVKPEWIDSKSFYDDQGIDFAS